MSMIPLMNWHREGARVVAPAPSWTKPFAPPVDPTAPTDPTDPSHPSTLNPNDWALEIMGMLAYYQMLAAREGKAVPGSAEDLWLKGQMANCVTFLQSAQAAEAAYEKANPGKTYLDPAFCDILKQSTTKTGTKDFSKWFTDNLENMDGTGSSFMDWFAQLKSVPSADKTSAADLLGYSFATSRLVADLDNTTIGQMGGIDSLFSDKDWVHPFSGYGFPSVSPEVIAYYLWTLAGSPSPTDPGWKTFTDNLGFMGNMLKPDNLPTPSPVNYGENFWAKFKKYQEDFADGKFPDGDTLDKLLAKILEALDKRFMH